MNMFEKVSSDHHKMSLAGGRGSPGLMSRRGEYSTLPFPGGGGGTLPCNLSHNVFDITYPKRMTDRQM